MARSPPLRSSTATKTSTFCRGILRGLSSSSWEGPGNFHQGTPGTAPQAAGEGIAGFCAVVCYQFASVALAYTPSTLTKPEAIPQKIGDHGGTPTESGRKKLSSEINAGAWSGLTGTNKECFPRLRATSQPRQRVVDAIFIWTFALAVPTVSGDLTLTEIVLPVKTLMKFCIPPHRQSLTGWNITLANVKSMIHCYERCRRHGKQGT